MKQFQVLGDVRMALNFKSRVKSTKNVNLFDVWFDLAGRVRVGQDLSMPRLSCIFLYSLKIRLKGFNLTDDTCSRCEPASVGYNPTRIQFKANVLQSLELWSSYSSSSS